jgi:hypothetical protein
MATATRCRLHHPDDNDGLTDREERELARRRSTRTATEPAIR